jgi:hypothetical protein
MTRERPLPGERALRLEPTNHFTDNAHSNFPRCPGTSIYRVKADTVWLVAVWHGAQLPAEPGDVERG